LRWRFSAGRLLPGQLFEQSLFSGEHAGAFFRINQLVVRRHFEHAAARGQQVYRVLQILFDFRRQTDGTIAIASTVAVFNGNDHDFLLKSGLDSVFRPELAHIIEPSLPIVKSAQATGRTAAGSGA